MSAKRTILYLLAFVMAAAVRDIYISGPHDSFSDWRSWVWMLGIAVAMQVFAWGDRDFIRETEGVR